MSDSMIDLERDIEKSRARLDLTIDRLQDKLTVSGVVDDTLGAVRKSAYAPIYDNVLATLRRNPVPVMLVAAGMAMIFYRMAKPPRIMPLPMRRDDAFAPEFTDPVFTDPDSLPVTPPALEPLGPDLDVSPRRY